MVLLSSYSGVTNRTGSAEGGDVVKNNAEGDAGVDLAACHGTGIPVQHRLLVVHAGLYSEGGGWPAFVAWGQRADGEGELPGVARGTRGAAPQLHQQPEEANSATEGGTAGEERAAEGSARSLR